jgi:hypothetical protein
VTPAMSAPCTATTHPITPRGSLATTGGSPLIDSRPTENRVPFNVDSHAQSKISRIGCARWPYSNQGLEGETRRVSLEIIINFL